jgi:hypothetical protein
MQGFYEKVGEMAGWLPGWLGLCFLSNVNQAVLNFITQFKSLPSKKANCCRTFLGMHP